MKTSLPLAIVIAILSACATTANYEEILNSWVGAEEGRPNPKVGATPTKLRDWGQEVFGLLLPTKRLHARYGSELSDHGYRKHCVLKPSWWYTGLQHRDGLRHDV